VKDLDRGADDFVVKPSAFQELSARRSGLSENVAPFRKRFLPLL